MREIAVIGVGYVGLVTGACFADLGNKVWCVDINEAKIESLKRGKVPFFEPGLEEIVRRNLRAGRIYFTTSYPEAIKNAQFIFIAVNTPEGEEGEADLSYVEAAAKEIARNLDHPVIIVNKSTVPIGTGDFVAEIIRENMTNPSVPFWVVSNPEFLREGSAVYDFMNPDRIVLGSTNREAAEKVAELYAPLQAPVIITDLRTAEMIKYASNAFLATKISFINEIANICEALGADVKVVAMGMGLDHRIGSEFLGAGIGWGGSCFPKDVRALAYMAATHGCHPQLLRAVIEINQDQRRRLVHKLRNLLGGSLRNKVVGILGLAFKPNTDDMREAPSVEIIHMLQHEGAKVKAYDPAAMENAKAILNGVEFKEDPYQVAQGADALILVTEWNEFKQLDMERIRNLMRQPILIDGRNIYDPEKMKALGFIYRGIGRGFDGAGISGGS
ncbi:MAG: UDP-glucose/GDP-mannose dehydrogenase family protein [Anaerolineae bacterium]|nr:UDP-glucose/GDP-mannose dehydrogenase family protein [Anaerolineae bacterium]MDW8103140.1 UDP-glucose/GDP-mannose dehydrogenase family protein [Anaerolineae bacterium]